MIICLEMTSPDDLLPGKPPPSPITLAPTAAASEVQALYQRIWAPLGPSGRTGWTTAQWTAELSQPGIHTYLATIRDAPAGFAELSVEADGVVGIVVFGLVPEVQSKGYGAAFLTAVTRTAWTLNTPTTRVWLQTSSSDHPHALRNYLQRGFRIFDQQERVGP
ncbi:GNAT family N-acetyltransferase [Kribbella antibiotica]|uniref:GNAT family N-acetyltransferase n=1 Tax=Kribbella antibiotica TaxID=190195 RepID=UPI0014043004|nr:GNAT family N-acetyltransferase [Kribbella antibiotica]